MKHPCLQCNGAGTLDHYECGWRPAEADIIGDVQACTACNGEGELEGCQCEAWSASECCCGAYWDDVEDDRKEVTGV